MTGPLHWLCWPQTKCKCLQFFLLFLLFVLFWLNQWAKVPEYPIQSCSALDLLRSCSFALFGESAFVLPAAAMLPLTCLWSKSNFACDQAPFVFCFQLNAGLLRPPFITRAANAFHVFSVPGQYLDCCHSDCCLITLLFKQFLSCTESWGKPRPHGCCIAHLWVIGAYNSLNFGFTSVSQHCISFIGQCYLPTQGNSNPIKLLFTHPGK